MAALRPLFVLGLAAAFVLAEPGSRAAAQESDVFSTNTEEAPAAPSQPGDDPMRCFDHALRNAKAAVQAYQVVYGDGWDEGDACPKSGGGAPSGLGSCWGDLGPARGLLEQAAQLFETGRKSPAPQSEQMIKQGNSLVRKAKALVDKAGRCFVPLFAQWRKNGGNQQPPPPGDGVTANEPGDGSGLLLKGSVEKHDGEPPDDESCDNPENPALDARLMAAAQDLDHMVDSATAYTMAATDRFFTVMSQTVEMRLKELADAAKDPGAAATKTVDAVVDYLASDYNANNERMYEQAVAAVDEIQQDPAAFFAKFAVDQAASAGTGAIGGGVTACVRKAKGAADAALKAQAIVKAERAAERLKAMQTRAGKFEKLAEDATQAPPRKPGWGDDEGGGFGNNSQQGGNAGGGSNPFDPNAPQQPMRTPSAEMVFCEGLENQCFPAALAQAETWDKGIPHVAMPTADPDVSHFPMKSRPAITNVLVRKYGGRVIKDLPPDRQHLQNMGWPNRMPSKQSILDELWAADDGAQGIIFLRQNLNGDGHVLNIGKFNGQIVWKDMTGKMESVHAPTGLVSETLMDPGFMLDANPAEIFFFRVR
ncbi:toxin glutamine deamidase domain-containing protein [Dongia sp.]|uniref:toxin glutamine deamidase domain-containing protein n=1 Tax=Dongia sp. TaxID=1977262 RepID=UPI003750D0D5